MLDALGNVGEFVGSIGVLVSLIYLAIQIKRSTETERTSTYQTVVSEFGRMNQTLATNPDLTILYVRAMEDVAGLDDTEMARVSQVFYMTFRFFENMYYQHRKGYIEDDVWIGWKRMMLTYFARPGFQTWWEHRRDLFNESFAHFLESAEIDRPVPPYAEIAHLGASRPGTTPGGS